MALATKCPHCSTIFRVAADQLKLRGGIVRCGSCALVFDGNAALVEPAPKPTPVIPDIVAEPPPAKPAVSDYVHGAPVDFEIDFSDEPAAVPPPAATPAEAEPAPAAPSPVVWRSAAAPAAQPHAPTPDDIALAAVARAFAAVTTHDAPSTPASVSPAGLPLPTAEQPRAVPAPTPAAEPSQAAAPLQAAAPAQAQLPQRAAEQAPAPVAAAAPARTTSSPATRSLIDVVSPDAAFTAAAEPSPPLVPEPHAMQSSARAKSPAGLSSLADLVAPDAVFSATAEPSPPLVPPPAATPSFAKAAPATGSAQLLDVFSPDATFSAATGTTTAAPPPATPAPRTVFTPPPVPAAPAASPAADLPPPQAEAPAEPAHAADESKLAPEEAPAFDVPQQVSHAVAAAAEATPEPDAAPAEPQDNAVEDSLPSESALAIEVPAPVDRAAPPAAEMPPQDDVPAALQHTDVEDSLPAEHAAAFEAPPQLDQAPAEPVEVAEESELPSEDLPPPRDETPTEPAQTVEVEALAWEETPAAEAPQLLEQVVPPADEASAAVESGEPAGASLVDAIDQWSADNTHPDGRIEPSLVTPQEHLVLAALDDAHHFEDLSSDELPAPDLPAADAEVDGTSEPSLNAEPWFGTDTAAEQTPVPDGEPWSLSEPDETALHAVAAVNTDAPDDGASVTDDEAADRPAKSRRERALKRAKSRRDTSGPVAEHEVFALEENGPEPENSAEQVAARMRAIAGVDETAAASGDLDHADLNFVKRVDRSQRYGRAVTITMAVGVPILLAGLVLQAATTFRDTLAANYPQLKPALTAVCQPLGCKIALPSQLDALSVEPGELASMTENTFSFSTVLRNQSKTPQAWPHVELTLNDNADKPVLRRVFAPIEYLPPSTEAEKGFGPRSEQSIKLYFELKELKASGYHIAIFYP